MGILSGAVSISLLSTKTIGYQSKNIIIDVAQSLGVPLAEKEIDDIDTSNYRSRAAKSGRTITSDPVVPTSSSVS